MKPLFFALLPAVALAAPPPSARRASALLIPMDRGAEAASVQLEGWMQEALAEFPGTEVKTSDELFGLPGEEESAASLQRAEKGFEESRRAFDSKDPDDAERKLRATIKEFQRAAGALDGCGHLCDALAMYAALLVKRGDTEEAKLMLLDLMSLDPTYELDAKKLGRDVVVLRSQTATGRTALLRGNATVKTRPAGARVYVDGEFRGFSPVTVNTLPVGKHLVRIERPGFRRHGELVEVTPDDVEVSADLVATAAWKAWDGQMDKVAQDASKGGGGALSALGKALSLDKALVGTLKQINENGGTEVSLGLFDLRSGKRLSHKRAVFQGDEYGQLKSEVARLVNSLLNSAGAPKEQARGDDPLDRKHGTEDWSGEDRGGRTAGRGKRASGDDPLDTVNGMEDW